MEFTFSELDAAEFAFNGTAMVSDPDIIQLTTESRFQHGSAWYEKPLSIRENTDLNFYAVVQLSAVEGGGADGLTVGFQSSSAGDQALGLDGGRLGYQGISNSLAIELDTYKNEWDLDDNHGALIVDGNLEDPLLNGGELPFNLDQGEKIHLWFEYSGSNDFLEVFLNNIDEKPDSPYLTTELQIENYLDSQAYFGFTAATGAKFSGHSVLETNLFVNNSSDTPSVNYPPAAPEIINPPAGSVINPASLKFQLPEDFTLDDPDGDQHGHTDYEIWLEGETQPAWVAHDVTDDFFKIHGIVPTIGTFVNSHSDRDSLLPNQNYLLRVRVADEGGAQSPWTEQINLTSSTNAPSPQTSSIPWEVLESGYAIDVVTEDLRLPVQLDFNTKNGLIVGSELHNGPFTVDSAGNVYPLAKLIDYDPGNDIGGQSERGAIGIAYHEESHSLFQGLLDAENYPVIYRLFLSDDGLSTDSMEKIWEYPDKGIQAHQIGNLAIHDNYLYVNMGDKFDPQTADDLDSPWGKILRLNLDGSAVAENPFYDPSDGINAQDYIYSYGYRNPIGGDWFDGEYYVVENGPNSNDRLAVTLPGENYGWNGQANSLIDDALYVWEVTESPVDISFDDKRNGYISLSGPTYGSGRSKGKTIDKVTIAEDGTTLVSPPTDFIRYTGDGKETASGLLYIPAGFDFTEGLYWTSLYPDNPNLGPTGSGARLYRVSEIP